jgi:hypothetical protein
MSPLVGWFLTETKAKQKQRILYEGRGKVEIQKQDFHFPTAPTACGSKVKTPSAHRQRGPAA